MKKRKRKKTAAFYWPNPDGSKSKRKLPAIDHVAADEFLQRRMPREIHLFVPGP